MSAAPSSVSIVIPALNEERHLGACLSAITGLQTPAPPADVVLVDDGSVDRTVEIAREFGARVLLRPGVRIGALRNAGAREARGDFIAFVDADCIVAPGWLEAARRAAGELDGRAIVGSFYRHPADGGWLSDIAEQIVRGKDGRTRYLPGGNMIVPRACFYAVGGFSETLETNEDVDFCRRARNAGYAVVSDPLVETVHLGVPRTLGHFFRREMRQGRTAVQLFWRELRRLTNLRVVLYAAYFALCLVLLAAGLAGAVWSGRPVFLAPALAGYVAVVVWLLWRVRGQPRPLSLTAYNVLYGCARGLAFLAELRPRVFRDAAHKP